MFASDYVRACFPNSIRLLDYAIGKTERMEDVAFGSQFALAEIDVGKCRNMVNGSSPLLYDSDQNPVSTRSTSHTIKRRNKTGVIPLRHIWRELKFAENSMLCLVC
jgi:hypothetical protein